MLSRLSPEALPPEYQPQPVQKGAAHAPTRALTTTRGEPARGRDARTRHGPGAPGPAPGLWTSPDAPRPVHFTTEADDFFDELEDFPTGDTTGLFADTAPGAFFCARHTSHVVTKTIFDDSDDELLDLHDDSDDELLDLHDDSDDELLDLHDDSDDELLDLHSSPSSTAAHLYVWSPTSDWRSTAPRTSRRTDNP
jgi:hypothetical protein